MLSQKLQDGLNGQLNFELYSAYVYLSMANYLESLNLKGMAHWMDLQAREELEHAGKFITHINDRGGRVLLRQIDGPKTEWASPLDAFEEAYRHECEVSARINGLVDLSINEKDHAANAFLQWFVTEQVEEEANVLEIVEKLKMVGDRATALFMIDRELSKRGAQ
jgi:ferritin